MKCSGRKPLYRWFENLETYLNDIVHACNHLMATKNCYKFLVISPCGLLSLRLNLLGNEFEFSLRLIISAMFGAILTQLHVSDYHSFWNNEKNRGLQFCFVLFFSINTLASNNCLCYRCKGNECRRVQSSIIFHNAKS